MRAADPRRLRASPRVAVARKFQEFQRLVTTRMIRHRTRRRRVMPVTTRPKNEGQAVRIRTDLQTMSG
jgi:hypothetical protein